MVFSVVSGTATYATLGYNAIRNALIDAKNAADKAVDVAKDTADNIFTKAWNRMVHFYNVAKDSRTFQYTVTAIRLTIQLSAIFFVVAIVFRMVIGFFQSPLEYIMLGIACITLSIIYVLYYIIGIWPFRVIPLLLYLVVVLIIPVFIYTCVILAIFALIAIIAIILALINHIYAKATRKSLTRLLLCQNSPLSWYTTPNYHLSNANSRSLFCTRPCRKGYEPDSTGGYCKKLERGVPSFCPQAQTFRIYNGLKTQGPVLFDKYPTMKRIKYMTSDESKRKDILIKYYLKQNEFLSKCKTYLQDTTNFNKNYDGITLQLCSNIDALNVDAKNKSKLGATCKQAFCNTRSNYTFCQYIDTVESEESEFWIMFIKLVIKLVLYFIIMAFIFIILFLPKEIIPKEN